MIGNHASYYKDGLWFLGCVDIEDLPVLEQQERVFMLGLEGLLGEGVFNFRELLMQLGPAGVLWGLQPPSLWVQGEGSESPKTTVLRCLPLTTLLSFLHHVLL